MVNDDHNSQPASRPGQTDRLTDWHPEEPTGGWTFGRTGSRRNRRTEEPTSTRQPASLSLRVSLCPSFSVCGWQAIQQARLLTHSAARSLFIAAAAAKVTKRTTGGSSGSSSSTPGMSHRRRANGRVCYQVSTPASQPADKSASRHSVRAASEPVYLSHQSSVQWNQPICSTTSEQLTKLSCRDT